MDSAEQFSFHREETLAGNTDTSLLKLLALLLMLVDHIGASLLPTVPELRVIGRMAFPLYAWCLVVGSVKTRSPLRYGLRLLGLAVVSQPLYMMALNHTWREMNILFTLTIALAAITGIRRRWNGSQFWAPVICFVLTGFLQVDYGWKGVLFIVLLYLARETKSELCSAYLAYALFWGASSSAVKSLFGIQLPFSSLTGIGPVFSAFFRLQGMIWLSLPLIVNQTRINPQLPKWLGYGLYPMHLLLLIALKLLNGGTFAMLVRGF